MDKEKLRAALIIATASELYISHIDNAEKYRLLRLIGVDPDSLNPFENNDRIHDVAIEIILEAFQEH
jgi:hypothetical protein